MSYFKDSKLNDANERIAKEYKLEKSETNAIQRKLREVTQADEQKRVNKYSEGFCYGCNKTDHIISTLFDVCHACRVKKGTEAVLSMPTRGKLKHALCDMCGVWKFDCTQVNASLCRPCMGRMSRLHYAYKKAGGFEGTHPFIQRMKKKYGKDYRHILGNGVRTIRI